MNPFTHPFNLDIDPTIFVIIIVTVFGCVVLLSMRIKDDDNE